MTVLLLTARWMRPLLSVPSPMMSPLAPLAFCGAVIELAGRVEGAGWAVVACTDANNAIAAPVTIVIIRIVRRLWRWVGRITFDLVFNLFSMARDSRFDVPLERSALCVYVRLGYLFVS